jgi:hypothetical protein
MVFGDTQPVDFNYFLNRKYQLLQQQADAGSTNAQSGALQAATGAIVGKAAAGLDTTRAKLLPAESASQIGLQGAQANLLGQQASVVVPEAQSRIRNQDANTGYTGVQSQVLTRDGLTTFSASQPGGALAKTLGPGGYTGFRLGADLSGPTPARRVGESEADYMNRINGL